MSHLVPNQIRELVKNGQLQDACELLITTRLSEKGLQHFSRLQELNDLVQTGQLDYGESSKEKSRIRAVLLSAAHELEKEEKRWVPVGIYKYLGIGLGLLLFLSIGIIMILHEDYEFVLNDGNPPVSHANGVLKIEQTRGKSLDQIYVVLGDQGSSLQKEDNCGCWMLPLQAYYLKDGEYSLDISLSQSEFSEAKVLLRDKLRIDNKIPEGRLKMQSYTTAEDSMLHFELKGRANEKVEVNIDLPFDTASIARDMTLIEREEGFYFMYQFKVPVDQAKEYQDKRVPIILKDLAGNIAVQTELRVEDLIAGNYIPPLGFGDYTLELMAGREPMVFSVDYSNLPDENPGNPPPSTPRPKDKEEKEPDSLYLWVKVFSSNQVDLAWRAYNSEEQAFIENRIFRIKRRILSNLVKDTLTDYATLATVSGNRFLDTTVKKGYQYGYYVEAIDEKNTPYLRSNEVAPWIPPDLQALNQLPDSMFKPLTMVPLDMKPPSNLDPNMVLIQGGKFEMGDQFGEGGVDEKPVHSVIINSFYLSKYEVSFEEYDLYVKMTGADRPEDEGWGRSKRPVINVSWRDAVKYCNWLSERRQLKPVYTIKGNSVTPNWSANGYRLPTEAEWEYAGRDRGKKMRFGNGKDKASPDELNFVGIKEYKQIYSKFGIYRKKTVEVNSLSVNSLKLYHMSGNVYEWCWDWYGSGYYKNSPKANPKGPDVGYNRVMRGGSWVSYASRCRVSDRYYWRPDGRGNYVGFRLARSL